MSESNINNPVQEFPGSLSSSKFCLYGLNIHCYLPLPFPRAEFDKADIEVCFQGIVARPAGPLPKTLVREWMQENSHWVLRYLGKGGESLEFIFDQGGQRIRIRQSYNEWGSTLFLLLNPAMAASLHLQGFPVLHASSLVREDVAFLFAGVSGAGKSSLAAALVAEGNALHSDDIGVIRFEKGYPIIPPGYPRLKITLQTAAALGWDRDQLKTIFPMKPEYDEKWLDVSLINEGFYGSPAPLRAIYVLSDRSSEIDAPQIDALPAGRGALALTKHLYGDTWLQKPGRRTMAICAQLADRIPIFSLRLPEGISRLRSSTRFLIGHMDDLKREADNV